MPRGKRGPVPEALNDPTAEEIVGVENVVDVGRQGYKCADCIFTSNFLSEIEEHCNGTQHGGYGTKETEAPQQAALFSEPGTVFRDIKVPLDAGLLNDKRQRLAELYQSALDIKEEKKEADGDFNTRLKNIDEQMQQIARVLKTPYTYDKVMVEWHVIDGENSRKLRRVDTGEVLETQPLTMEDKIAEEQKAAAENADPVAEDAEVTR